MEIFAGANADVLLKRANNARVECLIVQIIIIVKVLKKCYCSAIELLGQE